LEAIVDSLFYQESVFNRAQLYQQVVCLTSFFDCYHSEFNLCLANLTWCGLFQSQDNVSIAWSFGAAAYETNISDLTSLGVKPADTCPNPTDPAGISFKFPIISSHRVNTK
jgi:hypothetical protein